ncbi:MAG: hypothetical protein HN790_14850 [Methylococcales bacterium]|jgi:hypothetical protein|nr:hypothetical protein [Methylococcales bacterium]
MIRLVIGFLALILIFFLAIAFRKTISKLMAYVGLFIPLVSALLIAGTLTDIIGGTATDGTWFVFVAAIGGLITGLKMLWDDRRNLKHTTVKTQELDLLSIVQQHKGRVTPIDIAMSSDLTVEEAETALNEYCAKDIAEKEVTPTGKVLFVFSGFINETEKQQSKNPMDL